MDFKIDSNGDIDLNNLSIEYSDSYLRQLAICRIVSIDKDWYYDNIGANLEEVFSMFVIKGKTDEIIKEKIRKALFVDEMFNDSNVYIDIEYNKNLEYIITIYIKSTEYANTSINICVTLDLFNGKLVV